jgi:type I restriction enzyme, S subunit
VAVVPVSKVREDVARLDSDYFKRADLDALAAMRAKPYNLIGDIAYVTDGIHTSIPFREGSGVRVISAKHPKDGFFDLTVCEEIDSMAHAANPRTALRENDVILSTVGTIGNVAVVEKAMLPANTDRHVAIMRSLTDYHNPIDPHYLASVLASQFGRFQSNRETTGNVQPNLFLVKIRSLIIPRFGLELEQKVAQAFRVSQVMRQQSKAALETAEAMLIDALGLGGWSPPEPLTYIRSAAAVLKSARLDSQYYMPAKFQTLNALQAISSQSLSEVFDSVRDMINPAMGKPTDLVRNYDLTDALHPILDDRIEPVTLAEIGSQKKLLRDGDLAVSRLRAYLREIAVVRAGDTYPKVGSSEFFVLRPKVGAAFTLSPETLMVWLRSAPVQIILKWCQDGSQHPRFSEGDLMSIPLPDKLAEIDGKITALIQSGLEARADSFSLLTTAKRAVEIAIEDSEAAALGFLASSVHHD